MKLLILASALVFLILGCQTKPTVLKIDNPILTTSDQQELKANDPAQKVIFVDARNPVDVKLKSLRTALPFWWKDFTTVKEGKREWIPNLAFVDYFVLKGLDRNQKIVLLTDQKNSEHVKIAQCVFLFFKFKTVLVEDIKKFRELPSNAEPNMDSSLLDTPDWSHAPEERINCSIGHSL